MSMSQAYSLGGSLGGFLAQLRMSLRLYFRNRMGLIYGYLFPTIFLIAFWVLYRHEPVPLVRHMGELLTVTVLGGACFGLPTTLVSERERGVWRRYRLAPVSTGLLAVSVVVARYFILLTAGALQLGLAMAVGMPFPEHPWGLWVAFTFVAFAFLGLGLVIAMLADNVPAVQALGQCIFLPMLIIGGVAVRLESLPVWAQHVSAFFPGRYAVEALQAQVSGDGLGAVGFSLLALLLIGVAGCVAGARLFRWEPQQRFAARGGKGWVGVAVGMWVAVGAAAELSGRVVVGRMGVAQRPRPAAAPTIPSPVSPVQPDTPVLAAAQAEPGPAPAADAGAGNGSSVGSAAPTPPAGGSGAGAEGAAGQKEAPQPGGAREQPKEPAAAASVPPGPPPPPWRAVDPSQIPDSLFADLPPDEGVVAPIAADDEEPWPDFAEQLGCIALSLPRWGPASEPDLVQRVRNYLYVAAVPDMFQMIIERWVPLIVFERIEEDIPREDLIRILYWIATHPGEGHYWAVDELRAVCLDVAGPSDTETLEERTRYYALKLLARLTGRRIGD